MARVIKVVRTKAGRLHLFDEAVTSLKTESAANNTWTVTDGEHGITTEEPHREALRSYIMAVRSFDSPSERDLYIPRIIRVIEFFPIADATAEWVEAMRLQYRQAQVSIGLPMMSDAQGQLSSRECFQMLAYRNHLHYDIDREVRARMMGDLGWELVRQHGSAYASAIADTAIILRALARDDPATSYWFVPRNPGKESAVEWLEANRRNRS